LCYKKRQKRVKNNKYEELDNEILNKKRKRDKLLGEYFYKRTGCRKEKKRWNEEETKKKLEEKEGGRIAQKESKEKDIGAWEMEKE
jgi:hypothetical protein